MRVLDGSFRLPVHGDVVPGTIATISIWVALFRYRTKTLAPSCLVDWRRKHWLLWLERHRHNPVAIWCAFKETYKASDPAVMTVDRIPCLEALMTHFFEVL